MIFTLLRWINLTSLLNSQVGIPINYTYTGENDIEKSAIIVRGKPVDWNSQGGQLLEQSLVLTEDEQIFGIAREALQLQNHSVFLRSLYSSGTIVLVYSVASTLNSKLRLFYRPLSLRVALYGIVSCFGYGVYTLLTDYTQVSFMQFLFYISCEYFYETF